MMLHFETTTCFLPSESHLRDIEHWLQLEDNEDAGDGFFCNWSVIVSAYKRKQLIILLKKESPIGFVVWEPFLNKVVKLDIVEIHPLYRNKGHGKRMIFNSLDYFKQKDFLVVHLECMPEKSEPIWKALGFIEFPPLQGHPLLTQTDGKPLFKILGENSTYVNEQTSERIELWANEFYKVAHENSPNYTWNINLSPKSTKLKLPIIHPSSSEWRMRWIRDEQVIFDDQVKYFPIKIDFGYFVVIKELPYQ